MVEHRDVLLRSYTTRRDVIWFHYSMIEVPGRKTLSVGQLVHFTFESEVEQDGFVFRAVRVRPSI